MLARAVLKAASALLLHWSRETASNMTSDGPGSTKGLYEPRLPPYQELSSNNHGAYVLMTAVILVIMSGLAVAVKLQTTVSKFGKLRWDDLALITAQVCAAHAQVAAYADHARSLRSDTLLQYVRVYSMVSVAEKSDSPSSK